MTTIAYHHKDKQIAIDSRVTTGNHLLSDQYNKVIKNDIGTWFFSGSTCDQPDFVLLKHNDHVKPEPDGSALLIKDGEAYLVTVTDDKCSYTKLDYDYTSGSGCTYATGAMDHGKSALEAVKYAMTRDVNTGGRVRVFNVDKKEKK